MSDPQRPQEPIPQCPGQLTIDDALAAMGEPQEADPADTEATADA